MPTFPFIDFEASGFGPTSYPIEVGFVMANGESYCSLIRPEPDWRHWDTDAEKVHGIRRELLFEHGRAPEIVSAALNQHLAGMLVITDAWYHDFNWMHRLFAAAGTRPHFELKDLRHLLTDREAADWHRLRQEAQDELGLDRHRASHDARILQKAYLKTLAS